MDRAMRVRIGQLVGFSRAFKSVTSTTQGLDQSAASGMLELLPQAVDVDLNKVGLGAKLKVPNVLGDHGLRHHTSRIAHQVFEQGELFVGKPDVDAGARDLATGRVERDVADVENRRLAPAPAQQ